MISFIKAVLWRFGIGLSVSVIAVILSLLTSRWYISESWLGLFGLVVMAFAALPLIGGSNAAEQTAWERPQSYMDQFREAHGYNSSWSFNVFFIGLPNLLVSILVFGIVHQ